MLAAACGNALAAIAITMASLLLSKTTGQKPTEPNRDLRAEILRTIHAENEIELSEALDALRARAGERHQALILALFAFLQDSTSTREGMAFAGIRQRLAIPDRDIVAALAPLFEEADDKLNAAVADALREFEKDDEGRVDFTAYVPVLRDKTAPGLVKHMRGLDERAARRAIEQSRTIKTVR